MSDAVVDKKEKKRKRPSEKGEDRPKKKKSATIDLEREKETQSAPATESIKLIHAPKDDSYNLVVAIAPGITIPPTATFTPYTVKKELLLHSSEHPRLDYTAREQQDGGLEGAIKHYIAIFDPAMKEMRVLEAKMMSVRATVRSEDEEMRKAMRMKQESAKSARQNLGEAFGTKKARKALASAADNAVTSTAPGDLTTAEGIKKAIEQNPTAKAVMESMAASAASAPTKADTQALIDSAKPRPKHNPDAKTPADVYPIGELIGEDIMSLVKVKPWFVSWQNDQPLSSHSRFVTNRVEAFVESDNVRKAKVLKYLLYLIEFYKALGKGSKGAGKRLPKRDDLIAKLGDADAVLIDTIKRKFTDGTSEVSKWHVDNLVTHMAAVALIADDFETDTHDLREDLGLKRQEMEKYFKETGSKLSSMTDKQREKENLTKEESTQHKMAKLVLPLQFPKERQIVPKRA